MLMHDGELKFIGDPEECAARYYRLNFAVDRNQSGEELDRQLNAVADEQTARARQRTAHRRAGQADQQRRAGRAAAPRGGAARPGASSCGRRSSSTASPRRGHRRLRVHAGARRDGGDRVAAGRARAAERRDREPARAGPLHAELLGPPRRRRRPAWPSRRCGCSSSTSTAPLARYGLVSVPATSMSSAQRGRARSAPPEPAHGQRPRISRTRPSPSTGPVGAGRRLAALARAAHAARRHRLQEGLLRHRARLPVVARPAADALRRPARRVHTGVPHRLGGAELCGAAALQPRAVRPLPGGDDRPRSGRS